MSFNTFIKSLKSSKKAQLAVLIDPDKFNLEVIRLANHSKVACFLLGGSVLEKGTIDSTIRQIKKQSSIPIILFPGDETQLSKNADGLFLPSLLSGRNPDYLIEKHIAMAPLIKKMNLNYLPMAYLLIDGKKKSTTQKVTNTKPLDPKNKTYILNTCLAAQQLGFQLIYLEAGSGAKSGVEPNLIRAVKNESDLPLIVGGGLNSVEKVNKAIQAGADLIVVGNALEKNVHLLTELSLCF